MGAQMETAWIRHVLVFGVIAASALYLYLSAGSLHAQENTDDLRSTVKKQSEQLEKQRVQLETLQQRLDAMSDGQNVQPVAATTNAQQPQAGDAPKSIEPASGEPTPKRRSGALEIPPPADETGMRRVVESVLQENPGIGMPPGVQTGFAAGQGFFIRSAANPVYDNWQDQSRIPFELRIRGRIQTDYYFYKTTDNLNHLTGQRYEPEAGDFSQIEVKRLRLFWEGTAFDPHLRYQFQLDGNTRGLGDNQNNRIA
jgi:cell division protein FtsL